jgi:hypothetical protein
MVEMTKCKIEKWQFKSSMLPPWLLLLILTSHNFSKQDNEIQTLQISYVLLLMLMN